MLWFAWKFVPLWYQQQLYLRSKELPICCDLLENSYLCGISNNRSKYRTWMTLVVICLKIRTFVVSATTHTRISSRWAVLWFAWKFVPLWYQQQHQYYRLLQVHRCDLLENSYLGGISNNKNNNIITRAHVVICLKIRTFVVSATTIRHKRGVHTRLWFAWKFVPLWYQQQLRVSFY